MVRQVVGASGVARVRWASLPTVAAVLALAGVAIAAGTVQFDGSPGDGSAAERARWSEDAGVQA